MLQLRTDHLRLTDSIDRNIRIMYEAYSSCYSVIDMDQVALEPFPSVPDPRRKQFGESDGNLTY